MYGPVFGYLQSFELPVSERPVGRIFAELAAQAAIPVEMNIDDDARSDAADR